MRLSSAMQESKSTATLFKSNTHLPLGQDTLLDPLRVGHWVSIDPGDAHVGLATWHNENLLWAGEESPQMTVEFLTRNVGKRNATTASIGLVLCERWSLYAWAQASLGGNEFLTAQLIGAIKYICFTRGVPYIGRFASQGKQTYQRKPWKDWRIADWRAVGEGKVRNAHVKDAIAHGYNFLWENGWRP